MASSAQSGPARRSRRLVTLGAAVAACGAGAAWWVHRQAADGSLRRVEAAGQLRIGYAVEPPYASVEADGTVTGESPEVAREVARQLGLRTRWVHTGFGELIPALESSRFDVVAAGLFITPERAQRISFARPQLKVRPGWLTLAGNPAQLGAYDSMKARRELRLAVLPGSVEQARLGAPASQGPTLVVVPDALSGRAAVLRGAADGLALSWPTVAHLARSEHQRAEGGALTGQGPARLMAVPAEDGLRPDSQVAMALRRADKTLLAAVNAVLQRYLGSPAHLAMLQRFGLSAADVPTGAPP